MSRAGAQPNINAGEYSSLRLPLPPVTEQNAIVAVLSAWDRGIRQLSDLIAAKLRFKQGLMQQLLTGKRRFKEFRGNLVSASLGDIVDFVNGRAFKPSEWKSAGLPIIRIQNLNGSTEYNHFDGLYDDKHLVRPGDLLFSWSGSRGTSFGSFFWHGPEGLLNQHIFRVLPRSTVGKRYIGHVLRYVTGIIETKAHGSAGLVHVTKRELEKFHIDFSDNLDEQDRVATVLDNADHEIDLLRKELDALKTQKKGLMQKLLTGQVRVKLPKGGA
jgi:type I restriction enzyme S subunit